MSQAGNTTWQGGRLAFALILLFVTATLAGAAYSLL